MLISELFSPESSMFPLSLTSSKSNQFLGLGQSVFLISLEYVLNSLSSLSMGSHHFSLDSLHSILCMTMGFSRQEYWNELPFPTPFY